MNSADSNLTAYKFYYLFAKIVHYNGL